MSTYHAYHAYHTLWQIVTASFVMKKRSGSTGTRFRRDARMPDDLSKLLQSPQASPRVKFFSFYYSRRAGLQRLMAPMATLLSRGAFVSNCHAVPSPSQTALRSTTAVDGATTPEACRKETASRERADTCQTRTPVYIE